MRKVLTFVALAALVYNIYAVAIWLYAFSGSAGHNEAVAKYLTFFPQGFSTSAIHWMSLIVTVLSIVILANYKGYRNHRAFTACIIMQAAFLSLYTWQSL